MGDFNARVGRASDPTARIGMHGETTVNDNGRVLLSLLNTVNLYSLNARTAPVSPHQHITCDRSHGGTRRGSLIDYVIASADIAMPIVLLSASPEGEARLPMPKGMAYKE
jgi:hypothetical protein